MIDHVTIHVHEGTLDREDLTDFMVLIGLSEIPPNDPFEHGWKVRWFRQLIGSGYSPPSAPAVHLVETDDGEEDLPNLGHFCVIVPAKRKEWLAKTEFCERDSGSGRIWLRFENIRVEVRS
jgi:hypothetical protein